MGITNEVKTLRLGPTNCYFLICKSGYLMIDTSLPQYFQAFLEKLKTVGVDLSEISYLLLSHSHDDNAGYAAEIRKRTKCKIITHENAIESLKAGTILNVGKFLNRQARVSMTSYTTG